MLKTSQLLLSTQKTLFEQLLFSFLFIFCQLFDT